MIWVCFMEGDVGDLGHPLASAPFVRIVPRTANNKQLQLHSIDYLKLVSFIL